MAKNVIIHGNTYPDVPYIDVPKSDNTGDARFYDPSGATATAADVRAPKTFFKDGGLETGTAADNGAVGGEISTKDGTVTIPAGFSSGGTVGLSSSAKSSIISDNIKAGSSILGVNGKSTVIDTTQASATAISAATVLSGFSGYVNGAKVNGAATMPTIVQDSTTKGLRIS